MIYVDIKGDSEVVTYLRGQAPAIRQAVNRQIINSTEEVAALVRTKLTGGVLHSRSAKLLESVKTRVNYFSDTVVEGQVYSKGVPYAAIQEYGGQIPAHIITPRTARVLRFFMSGMKIFAMFVRHPGARIPERSYLRSSLEESREKILADVRAAIRAVE